MMPSPDQQQPGRYRSAMRQPAGMMPGGPPAGGPPSFTGGTPSGMQPMNAGLQQRGNMPAPWDGGMQSNLRAAPQQPDMPPAGPQPSPPMGQRMPAPWTPPAPPAGGAVPRPQYQGAPGPMQRTQMAAPQQPGNPMTMRQNAQQDQNRQNNTF